MPSQSRNPFKVGDLVRYMPSSPGADPLLMTDLSALVAGRIYRVVSVQKLNYLVLEAFERSACGGLHWSEFSKAEA
jgi:hypothetical protein